MSDGARGFDPAARAGPLAALLQLERHRAIAAGAFEPDPARIAAGWQPRFVADAARTREAVELYQALGLEVCADPVRGSAAAEQCRDCQLVALLQFRMIYTRRPQGGRIDADSTGPASGPGA